MGNSIILARKDGKINLITPKFNLKSTLDLK